MSVTIQRLFADPDDVVHGILAQSGATVGANLPANLDVNLPYIAARKFSGTGVHPQFAERALVSVSCYADTRRGASDLAETCRALLWQAHRKQTSWSSGSVVGSLAGYSESSTPAEVRTDGQLDNVWRFEATYSLTIRTH